MLHEGQYLTKKSLWQTNIRLSDMWSLFAYCSSTDVFGILNNLMSSQIFQHATKICVTSLRYQMKILDFIDRLKCVLLKKVDEDL